MESKKTSICSNQEIKVFRPVIATKSNILKRISKLQKKNEHVTLSLVLPYFKNIDRMKMSILLRSFVESKLLDNHRCLGMTVIGKSEIDAYRLSVDGREFLKCKRNEQYLFWFAFVGAITGVISIFLTIFL